MRLTQNTFPVFALLGVCIGIGLAVVVHQRGVRLDSLGSTLAGGWRCENGSWVQFGLFPGSQPRERCGDLSEPQVPAPIGTPVQQVAQSFYQWYILQEEGAESRAYQSRQELAPEFVLELDEQDVFPLDPFWLAAGPPESFSLSREEQIADKTVINLITEFQGASQSAHVVLESRNGQWMIVAVTPEPDGELQL